MVPQTHPMLHGNAKDPEHPESPDHHLLNNEFKLRQFSENLDVSGDDDGSSLDRKHGLRLDDGEGKETKGESKSDTACQPDFDEPELNDLSEDYDNDEWVDTVDIKDIKQIPRDELWQQELLCDPHFGEVYRAVERKGKVDNPGSAKVSALLGRYKLESGVLFYLPEHKDGKSEWVRAVPERFRPPIMAIFHSLPWSGHLGAKKCAEVIRRSFFWPRLLQDVQAFCSKCSQCITAKARRRNHALPQVPEVVVEPFHTLHIDHCGPFPQSIAGNKYVLSVVDAGSGWVEMLPVPDKTAETTASVLWSEVMMRYGCPTRIVCDNAREFGSNVVKELMRIAGVTLRFIAIYAPHQNGMVERRHRDLNNMTRTFLLKHQHRWEFFVSCWLFAVRRAPRSGMGVSPAYLMFGREMRGPVEAFLAQDGIQVGTSSDLLSQRVAAVGEALAAMETYNTSSKLANRDYLEKRNKPHTFKEGDYVLYFSPHQPVGSVKKIWNRWTGPYRIHKVISPVTYVIAKAGLSKMVHIGSLIPFPMDKIDPAERQELKRDADIAPERKEARPPSFPSTEEVKEVTQPQVLSGGLLSVDLKSNFNPGLWQWETTLLKALEVGDMVVFAREQKAWVGKILVMAPYLEIQYYRSRSSGPTEKRIFNPAWLDESTGTEHWEPAQKDYTIPKSTLVDPKEILVGGFQLTSRKIPTQVLNTLREKFQHDLVIAVALVNREEEAARRRALESVWRAKAARQMAKRN